MGTTAKIVYARCAVCPKRMNSGVHVVRPSLNAKLEPSECAVPLCGLKSDLVKES